jgi:hypothetical protein
MSSKLEIETQQPKPKLVPCVILKSPDGATRLIRAGEPYRLLPGEKVDGVDRTCAGTQASPKVARNTRQTLAQELDQAVNGGLGDWIKVIAKPLAKLAGKTNCTACEARRIATNAYAQLKGKYGQLKAMSIMKELWEISFKKDSNEVLAKLKEYLDAD